MPCIKTLVKVAAFSNKTLMTVLLEHNSDLKTVVSVGECGCMVGTLEGSNARTGNKMESGKLIKGNFDYVLSK